jgi:hypothetical protein
VALGVVWLGRPSTEEEGPTPSVATPEPERVPDLEAKGRAAGVRAAPVDPLRRWTIGGTITSRRPSIKTTRVIAHWWPKKPTDDEPPVRVIESAALDVSSGSAAWSIKATGEGFVRLFLDEGDRRVPMRPWFVNAGFSVRGGRGFPRTDGVVGTYAFRGRALDKQGLGVASARLVVSDPVKDAIQAVITGPDGSFALDGLLSDVVEVTYEEKGSYRQTAAFAGFRARRVTLGEGAKSLVLRMPRNPWVVPKVGATIGGTFYRTGAGQIGTTKLLADGEVQPWGAQYMAGRHGLYLTPGRWRLTVSRTPSRMTVVDTGQLRTDDEVEVEFDVDWHDSVTMLGLDFDQVPDRGEGRVRCSARALEAIRGQSGQTAVVFGSHPLLILGPGRYAVAGAVGRGDTVRMGAGVEVALQTGDRRVLLLRTELAGGVRVPALPNARWGAEFFQLDQGPPPGHVSLDGETLALRGVSHRTRPTTWWLAPGAYTFRRVTQESETLKVYPVIVKAGVVTPLDPY